MSGPTHRARLDKARPIPEATERERENLASNFEIATKGILSEAARKIAWESAQRNGEANSKAARCYAAIARSMGVDT